MSDLRSRRVDIEPQDSPGVDAFGRWRVSNPFAEFESKQLFDNQPLFWDEKLESGASISSAHSTATASTVITSTNTVAGKFTRQTFMRFNYQPGNGQLVYMTGVLDRSGGGTGVQRRIGYFDDDNGLFFEDDEGTVKVVRRTKTSGVVVNNKVAQSSWNLDTMDGNGPSGVTIDWTKAQQFIIDFEWLSVGRVRMLLKIAGRKIVVHEFLNANVLTTAYMSTPNLPLRYQMVTTGSSPASTMECICTSVVSEGGVSDLGILRYTSTGGTHNDLADDNVIYAIIGMRLKSTHLGATIKIKDVSLTEHTGSKEYEWILLFNPTVANTFTYGDETNSAVQTVLGGSTNTVTSGTAIGGGMASSAQKGGTVVSEDIENALRLGAKIDGTRDQIVLCVRPIGGTTALDIEASITRRELS